MKRKQMSKSLKQKCKKVLVGALAIQMVIGSPLSTFAGENKVVVNEEVMKQKAKLFLIVCGKWRTRQTEILKLMKMEVLLLQRSEEMLQVR